MNNSDKKNLLVTLSDKNYLDFAKQLFSSVYFNSGWQGDYMLLAHEVPEEDLKWFRDKGILIRKCEPLADFLPGQWPVVILSKLYLFTEEFKKWRKIIYLNADVMVCASLDELLKTTAIAGTCNYNGKLMELKDCFTKDTELDQKVWVKYNTHAKSFASCIIVFNPAIITENTFNNLVDLAIKGPVLCLSADEVALNLYFNGRWEKVSPLYRIDIGYIASHTYLNPKKVKGIVIDFFNATWPIDYFKETYRQWKNNLDKADRIDLNNRLPASKIWSEKEIKKYSLNLRIHLLFFWPKFFVVSLFSDRLIGLAGIFLKRHHPWLYQKLLNIKEFKFNFLVSNRKNFPAFIIREYQASDEAGLITLSNLIFKNKMDINKWRWRYKQCPGGFELLVAVNEKNEAVGQFGRLINRVIYYGQERLAHQIVDVSLRKEYHGQNFMRRCFSRFMAEADFLVYGFSARRLAEKYRLIGSEESKKEISGLTFKVEILGKKIGFFYNLKNRLTRRKKQFNFEIGPAPMEEIAEKINSFWQIKKSELKISVIRDWQYLKWRLIDSWEKINIFLIEKNGKMVGYFALKMKNKTGIIMDILVLSGEISPALIFAIEKYCQKNQINKIKLMITDKTLIAAFKAAGYKKNKEWFLIYYDHLRHQVPETYLTLSDVDWDLGI